MKNSFKEMVGAKDWSRFKRDWERQVGNISIISSFMNLYCKKKRNEAIAGMVSRDEKEIS